MGRFDDIKDRGLVSRRGEEILKARDERAEQRSVGEIRVLDRIQQSEKDLDNIMKNIGDNFDKKLDQITSLGKKIDALKAAASRLESARGYSGEKAAGQAIRSSLSPRQMTEDITSVSRSSQNLGASVAMAQSTSTFQLEQQRDSAKRLMGRQAIRVQEAFDNKDKVDGGRAAFSRQLAVQDRLTTQAGLADASLNTQKRMGIDTKSQYFSTMGIVDKIKQDRNLRGIQESVESGAAGSRDDVQEKLDAVSQKLIDTFDKLNDVMSRTTSNEKEEKEKTKDQAALEKETGALQSSYSDMSNTAKAMDRMGTGGGAIKEAGGIISDVGVITQGAAAMYKNNYITSEMQQTQNRQGYAQLSNQRFEDVYGAGTGDMAALRRVMSDQYSDQAARGSEYRDRGQFATGLATVGIGTKTVGTGIDAATSAETWWQGAKGAFVGGPKGATVGAVANVGATMMPDAMQFNQSLTDYRKDLTAGSTDIAAQRQYRAYQDEKFKVRDFGAQKGMDYFKALGKATRGLGVGADAGDSEMVSRAVGTGRDEITDELDTEVDRGAHASAESVVATARKRLEQETGKSPWEMLQDGGQMFRRDERDYLRSKKGKGATPAKRATPLGTSIIDGKEFRTAEGVEGGGGDRESAMSTLMDKDVISRLADTAGISQKAIPGLVAGFKGAIGKEFVAGGVEKNLTLAGQAARSGYMDSPEQYIQARGQLSGVGGSSSDDLEKIMKQAVAAGMDSSKNIMEMVGAVQELNANAATSGASAITATTEMLGRGQSAALGAGMSKNVATAAALKGATTISDFGTSDDFDIFNVMEMSELTKEFSGAKQWELDAIARSDPKELAEMHKLFASGNEDDLKKAKQLAENRGIGGQITDADTAKAALDISVKQVRGRQGGLGDDRKYEKMYQEAGSDADFSKYEAGFKNWLNAKTNQTAGRDTHGVTTANQTSFDRIPDTADLKKTPGGKTVDAVEKGLDAPGVADAKIFQDTAKLLEKSSQNLIDLAIIQKDVAAGTNLAQVFEQTKEAAIAMRGPADTFSESMPKFNTTISTFTTKMEGMINKMEGIIKSKVDITGLKDQGTKGKKKGE